MNEPKLGGLLKSKYDPRHFVVGAVFGVIDPSELPPEYIVGTPLEIKDQKKQARPDMCAACAGVSASEFQEGKILNVEYQFAKIKQIMGNWESWGADMISMAKSLKEFGSVEQGEIVKEVDFNSMEDGEVGNPENYPAKCDELAKKHKKQAYFVVRPYGGLDLFDSIRSALWQFRNEKRALPAGTKWANEWASQTFIKELSPFSMGHALLIEGWSKIEFNDYLIIQNSGGEGIGQKGIQYFGREVVNKRFTYDVVMFKDMEPEEIEGIKKNWTWWQKLWNFFARLFK